MVRIGLIQLSGNADRDAGLEVQREWIKTAAAGNAQILCFPELINVPYFCGETDPNYFDLAETIDGPSLKALSRCAREFGVVVVYPFFEREREGEFYNSAAVIDPEGTVIGRYRKAHIPCLRRGPGKVNNEKYYFRPGNLGFPVFRTPFDLSVGVLICYDRHYPEAASVLGLGGADLILVANATSGMTQDYWEQELRAHAWFNHYYVGGINRVGLDRGISGPSHYGHSMFVDPYGKVLQRADDHSEMIVFGEVDALQIAEVRRQWPFLRDRRPELYGSIAHLNPSKGNYGDQTGIGENET